MEGKVEEKGSSWSWINRNIVGCIYIITDPVDEFIELALSDRFYHLLQDIKSHLPILTCRT